MLSPIELPVPAKFNHVWEDIYPLKRGGFVCMMCRTEGQEWDTLHHEKFCVYSSAMEPSSFARTHGEASQERQRKLREDPEEHDLIDM